MNVYFIPKYETKDYVMFLCDSLKIFNVNETTKNIVEEILYYKIKKENILRKYNISEESYSKIHSLLEIPPVPVVTAENTDTLYKLVLNITNKCNLGCLYCYACGGNYDSFEGIMSVDTAKTAIDIFLTKYKNIKYIQFFGGEPLLNVPLIKFVCEYFEEKFINGAIGIMPEFGTISNGTICNDELIDLINKYKISVTFSIDGPSEIHDTMRVFKNGEGTLNVVAKNIEKMKKLSAQPTSVEVTYSAAHTKKQMSVVDTIKFIKNTFQIENIHLVPVSVDFDSPYRLKDRSAFEDSVHEIFKERIKNGKDYSYSFVNRIIKSLEVKKVNKYLCEGGISSFSVSHKGDVYPCFMFTDIQNFRMGSIHDSNLFTTKTFVKINQLLKKFSKFEYSKCKSCFNNRICSGCLGLNYFNNSDFKVPTDEECEMQKKLTEQVLIELSNL